MSVRSFSTKLSLSALKDSQKVCSLICIVLLRSMRQPAERHAEVVGPYHQGDQSFPERQLQVSEGEQPAGEPDTAHKTVLLDADSFGRHIAISRLSRDSTAVSNDARGFEVVTPCHRPRIRDCTRGRLQSVTRRRCVRRSYS